MNFVVFAGERNKQTSITYPVRNLSVDFSWIRPKKKTDEWFHEWAERKEMSINTRL